jgi:hypothetical protein
MDGKPPTYEELLDLTRRQARQIDELRAEVERLKSELEQTRRAEKRQAAPFSKGAPKAHPKRPGRKAGHPPSHRPAPPPEQVDRTIEVPLPPECPECHAPLDGAPVTVHDQYQIDLPEPKPIVTRFRVPVARCPACFRRVQGRHPEQTSDARGAAAVQYGPRLLGFAADLRHRIGASYRKCSSVLLTLTGLVVASAALVRSGHRLRRLAMPSYDRLVEAARHSAVQHVDETGGKIGGRSAWLWVFADEHATLYRIRKSRGHEVVVEVLGEDYQGVLSGAEYSQQYPGPGLIAERSTPTPVRIIARASLRSRPGRLDVDLEPSTLEKIRPALISRRAQNPLQDHGDSIRALLGDGLEHLAVVFAVELRQRCQVGALEDQFDDGLAGRPFHGHQVPGEGVGRERHRDLEAGDPDYRILHGTILLNDFGGGLCLSRACGVWGTFGH